MDVSQAENCAPADSQGVLGSLSSTSKPLRTRTNTAEIDSTIIHPGSVKINVKGAFIVDDESSAPAAKSPNGGSHHTKDIRLPNHTAVVSHIAIDVSPVVFLARKGSLLIR